MLRPIFCAEIAALLAMLPAKVPSAATPPMAMPTSSAEIIAPLLVMLPEKREVPTSLMSRSVF
jgi:hypothetical protein